jgi:hypothetical protein
VLTTSQPESLSGRSEIIIVALALAALLAAEWVLTSVIPGTQYAQDDGKMAQAVIHTALTFGGSFQFNNINPLQGFGTQLLPHNVWLNPAYWPFAIFDSPLALDVSALVGLGILALACYVMARCFDVPVLPSIIGAQLSIILFGPLAFLLTVYQVFWINPGIAVVYAPQLVALGILGRLEPGRIKHFILATGGIFGLLLYGLSCDPLWTMISGIGLVCAFAVVALSPLRIRAVLVRCAALVCCVLLLLISGAGEYLYTLSRYSARVWFSEPLAYVPAPTLASIVVIAPKTMGALYAICTLGLLLGALFACGRTRVLVLAGLVSVVFALAYGTTFLMMRKWWLPLPLYIEHNVFPLVITAAVAGYWTTLHATGRAVAVTLGRLRDKAEREKQPAAAPLQVRPTSGLTMGAAWSAALVVAVIVPAATASYGVRITPTLPDYDQPFTSEPELLGHLEKRIGLRVGGEFRGSVTLLTPPPPEDQPTLFNFWRHNIPTANEYNQLVTPQAMYFTSAMFKYDIVLDFLNWFGQWIGRDTSYDLLFKTLRSLGVRYVIVYDPFGEAEKRHFPHLSFPRRSVAIAVASTNWLVYELPDPNLGNYSPTDVTIAKTGAEIVAAISDPQFDFAKQAVVSTPIDAPLVPAANMRLSVIGGGLHASGSSNGTSLVVLPQQFSHCLRAHDARVRLVRANLLMTGLIFSGNVDTDITFDYGIFSPGCRRTDLADTTELLGRPKAAGGPMFADWDEIVARFGAAWAAMGFERQDSPPAPPPPEESAPSGPAITTETVLADLPPAATPGFKAVGLLGLNASVENGSPVVSGQPILRLVAVPTSGRHYVAAQFTGLDAGRVYRIAAWVKAPAAVKVEIEVSDEVKSQGGLPANYGAALFDPAAQRVLSASGLLKGRGVEQGPDEWRKIWINMATSTGDFLLAVGLVSRQGKEFKGDGRLGLTLGGIDVTGRQGQNSPPEPSPSAGAITAQTVLADLPPTTTPGFATVAILGLNARVEDGSPVVSGQPILRLVAVSAGRHYLAAQFTTLEAGQVYRIAAWVKAPAGVKLEMEVSDELKSRGGPPANYGAALFDPARNVLSASGLLKGRGIEQGPDGWRRIWMDLATSSGDFILSLGLVGREGKEFKGDGHLGLTFGGLEVAARN